MNGRDWLFLAVMGYGLYLCFGGKLPDNINPAPTVKATSVHLIYEKDEYAIPSPVAGAINQVNRLGIQATMWDDDVVDGTGEIPDQHKIPLAEARKAGMPTLVVMAGDKVLRVVKDPKTEADVMEAIK